MYALRPPIRLMPPIILFVDGYAEGRTPGTCGAVDFQGTITLAFSVTDESYSVTLSTWSLNRRRSDVASTEGWSDPMDSAMLWLTE